MYGCCCWNGLYWVLFLTLSLTSYDKVIASWDLSTGAMKNEWSVDGVATCLFYADKTVFYGSENGDFGYIQSEKLSIPSKKIHPGYVSGMIVSRNGQDLISGGIALT